MKSKLLSAVLLCLALANAPVHAALLYWSANGTAVSGSPGTWDTTAAHWGTSTSGPFTTVWNNANTDSATLSASGAAFGSVVLGVGITMNGTLSIEQTPGTWPSWTINGANTMTFGTGSVLQGPSVNSSTFNAKYAGTITKTGAGTIIFNNSGGNVTKFILSAGTSTFSAGNRFGSGTDRADFLTFNGGTMRGDVTAWGSFGKSITINSTGGAIVNSAATVAMTLDKPITWSGGNFTLGTGTFTMSSTANSGTGTLTCSAGALTLGASGVIPDALQVSLTGGDLATGGFAETVDKLLVNSSSSTVSGTGPLTVNTLIDLRASGTIGTTIIAGAANATKTTSGMVTLTGANTFSGGLTLSAGVLRVGNNSALGTGKLTLVAGRLSANSATARTLSVPVDLSGNVTLGTNTVDTGNLTFQTGAWTITGATRTITTDTNTITINSAIGEDASGRGLIKAGPIGVLALNNAANTYSGDTTISAGQINIDADGSLGDGTGTLHLSGGNLTVTASRTAAVPNPVDLTTDAAITTTSTAGTVDLNLSGTIGGSAGTLTFRNDAASGTGVFQPRFSAGFTFGRPIVIANGSFGTTLLQSFNTTGNDQTFNGLVSGAGKYKRTASTGGTGGNTAFTAANTYSGGTTLGDGGIGFGIDSAGTPPTLTSGPIGTGALTVSPVPSGSPSVFASGGARIVGNAITLNGVLGVSGANDLTLSGDIGGSGGLTMSGAGTLTLSGANAYGGGTTVGSGTVDAAAAGTLGTGNLTVASGATVKLDAVGAIGSTASLVLASGTPLANLNFAGTSTIAGLSFDGGTTFETFGTWGTTASGATHTDDVHFTGNGQLLVTVAPSSTALATSGSPSGYGDTVTFTATVNGAGATPTGTVTFKDGAATIGSGALDLSGVATLNISTLAAGVHASITAVYSGDGSYFSSASSPLSQTVTQAVLTVTATGILVYGDDPTNAVYTPNYAGFQNGDTNNVVSGSANFSTDASSTSHIGTNYIAHVVDTGTLTAANYLFAAGSDGVLTVTNRPLSVTNVVSSKNYDGTIVAPLDASGAGLENFVNGDEASVTLDSTGATGVFDDKNAAPVKTVTCSGFATAGDLGTNYYVVQPITTGTINLTNLTVTAAADTKDYDGTTSAASLPTITAGSIQTGDIEPTWTETYDTKHVGAGKTLTPAGFVNDGNGGLNYNYTYATVDTGVINQTNITVTAAANTKDYDGTTSAAATPTVTLGNVQPGDTANFVEVYDTKHAGAGKTLTPSGIVTDGNSGNNYAYSFVPDTTGAINQTNLTVTAAANTKGYDGTTSAAAMPTITAGSIQTGDTPPTWTETYDTRHAGTGKTLTPAGVVNDGNGGLNYSYAYATVATGVISQTNITITAATNTKDYDGTTSAAAVPTVTAGSVQPGDVASFVEAYGTKHVGTGKTLTPSGTVTDGNSGNDYAYTFLPDTTGVVNQTNLTVTAATNSRDYDGTTNAAATPTVTAGNVQPGDTASFVEAYDTKHAGTGKTLTPAGTVTDGNSGNNYAYTFLPDTTGVINQTNLTVTAEANTKDYDGTTSAAAAPTITAGSIQPGDAEPVWTESYDTKHAGAGKTLTPAGVVNDGNSGLNYSYTYATVATGVINQTNLTVTAAANTKDYDGTPSAAAAPTITAGSIQTGDIEPAWTETYDSKHAGAGKTLTPAGVVNDGNGGLDYSYTYATVTTGVVNQTNITVTAATNTKPYDGDTSAAATPTVTSGSLQPGDTGNFAESYDTPSAGTGKTLTPSGSVTDGNGGANYNVSFADNTTGEITAASSATALTSSLNPSTNGDSVTFTATVSSGAGTPTGDVVFKTNGVALATVTLVAGVANTATADLPVGTNTVTAEYAAQDNWSASTNSLDQVVKSTVVYSQTNAILSIVDIGGGSFDLTFQGTPDAEYYVVASADVAAALNIWTPVTGSTNTAPSPSGQWSLTVSNAAPQYYRLKAVNPAP